MAFITIRRHASRCPSVLAFALLAATSLQAPRVFSQETEPPKPTPLNDHWQRIQDEVSNLPDESFEESVALLASLNLYVALPFGSGGVTLDVLPPPELDRYAVRMILSNSRFLKVVQQLHEAPGRMDHIKKTLAAELEEYEKSYLKTLKSYRESLRKHPGINGWSFSAADNGCDPLKNPTLPGQRLQVFSLLLACSMSPDKEAAALCEKAIDIAFKQRKHLLESDVPLGLKSTFLSRASLFNRRILATCLVKSKGIDVDEDFWKAQFIRRYGASAYPGGFSSIRIVDAEYLDVESHLKIARELNDDEFLKLLHESGYQQKN